MEKSVVTKSGSLTDSRRKFIENAGLAVVLGTFGASFFTSCSSSDDDPAPVVPPGNTTNGITIAGNTITIDLNVQTALKNAGNWLLITNTRTLVANVNGSYVSLSSVCTHSGCFDNWTFSSNRFTCTCHNSVFDPSGAVLNGPASSPLAQYTTRVTGTNLVITR